MSELVSFDLDDLDDDDFQDSNDFDLNLSNALGEHSNLSSAELSKQKRLIQPEITLESILNESDDDENDEILKSLTSSLTTLSLKPQVLKAKHSVTTTISKSEINQILNEEDSYTEISSKRSSRNSSFNLLSQNLIERHGIVCKQTQLKQIANQLNIAVDRSDSGLPTAIAVNKLIAVGTSRGLVLLFDSNQALKLYISTEHKDAISALDFNNSSDRLLAGNALGYIFMFDTSNGKCLRQITEAHPYGNAVLNLKFTDDPTVACFSDSGGSVFMLEFKRIMGVRSADSTCLFSGSKGEVCYIEPLKFEKFSETIVDKIPTTSSSRIKKSLENIKNLFNKYSILAMASFTKIFVVTLKPKLTVLFTFPLSGNAKYLPIINWQFVIMQQTGMDQAKRIVTPILSCARESNIHFFQLDYLNEEVSNSTADLNDPHSKFKISLLKKSEFKYNIYNFCWLNAKTIAILDNTEKLHICDIKSNEELQVMNNLPECVQLVFNSSFFKSLATGGYVSKALAYAGESACYQTFKCHLGQLFLLGTKSITLFSLQNWSNRIDDFVNQNNLDLALDLSISMYKGETKALIGLPNDTNLRKEKITEKIVDILYLYINRAMQQDSSDTSNKCDVDSHYRKCSTKCIKVCVEINRQDLLFENLYDLLSCDQQFVVAFLESLEGFILNDNLKQMPAFIIKEFIEHYSQSNKLHLFEQLEKCILHFEISNIDLHNVLQTCRKHLLIDALIYLHNKAFGDYVTPFEEIFAIMQANSFLNYEIAKLKLKENPELTRYGNKLLMYVYSCLCGQSYPSGNVENDELSDTIRKTTFNYIISKSNKMIDTSISKTNYSYPVIRIFLNYDASDFLNVISMSFNDQSFEAVIGLEKKQQLIDILVEISFKDTYSKTNLSSQVLGDLYTFLARQIANISNNIQLDNAIFAQMIEFLCNREDLDRIEEREQTLLALLNSFSIRIAEKLSLDRLLSLALKARFYRVCEIIYELRGEYYQIVDCYLAFDNPLGRQRLVFDVVRNLIKVLTFESQDAFKSTQLAANTDKYRSYSRIQQMQRETNIQRRDTVVQIEPRDLQMKKLQEKLLNPTSLKQMISIDPNETIYLIWIEMNLDLKYLIKTISEFGKSPSSKGAFGKQSSKTLTNNGKEFEDDDNEDLRSNDSSFSLDIVNEDELLYKFMKGLFSLAELIKTDHKYITQMSQFGAEYTELYVDLMCRFEPEKLLYLLKSVLVDYPYRVEQCLRICRERNVWDAAAYLLEKSGQVEAAFSIHLEKIGNLIKDLQKNLEIYSDLQLSIARSNIDAMLIMVVQLCQRNSSSLSEAIKQKIWFSLFDEIMRPIRSLVINPSIEALLEYGTSDDQSQEERIQSQLIKQRLSETRDFFKGLGSYIINNMVGYINLTIIIDRIICDPLYGASNFGDIKDLMLKMLEIYSYEETLLSKTSSLLSQDVYSKMINYKEMVCKPYSSLFNFCQHCSNMFESLTDEHFDLFENKIIIYRCNHAFHQYCLETMQTQELSCCPICNSTNSSRLGLVKKSSNKKNYSKYKKNQTENEHDSSKLPNLGSLEIKEAEPTTSMDSEETKAKDTATHGFNLILSTQQIAMLKSIRTRNHTSLNMPASIYKQSDNINLFKQNKLQLAPKNLSHFSR